MLDPILFGNKPAAFMLNCLLRNKEELKVSLRNLLHLKFYVAVAILNLYYLPTAPSSFEDNLGLFCMGTFIVHLGILNSV